MPNRSHFNSAHRMMNHLRKTGQKHSSEQEKKAEVPDKSYHAILQMDALELLRQLPDECIQLVCIDPPYNIDIAKWDSFTNYGDWSAAWLKEVERVVAPSGNIVIFGGLQYQDEVGSGDLLEIVHYLRHNSNLRLVNLIIWHYKNGMSAHRFFANRHEEIVWYAKTRKYTFNLDDVRIPYDEATKKEYLRDPRLNPETIEKGKNPTNVWEINRLNGNAKERVGHPTQKPVELLRRIVRALSSPGDIVLDFFAGSGSIVRVCIEENRHTIAGDIDPELPNYLKKHLKQLDGLFLPQYELLDNNNWREQHPLFEIYNIAKKKQIG